MSRLSVTPVGREASTVTMYISYGVSGLRSADQMRRFESSGLIENCVFRRLDQLVFIPSDRSDRLFSAVLNKFSLIQASIDNAVPRARVAELLAETQVLIGDLAMEKTRPSTVDLVRDLFTAYKQRIWGMHLTPDDPTGLVVRRSASDRTLEGVSSGSGRQVSYSRRSLRPAGR